MDYEYNGYIYKIYSDGKSLVVATAKIGGRTVRAEAKCAEDDEFNYEKGAALAATRCAYKIALKRRNNAENKWANAVRRKASADAEYYTMQDYLADAEEEVEYERNALHDLIKDL